MWSTPNRLTGSLMVLSLLLTGCAGPSSTITATPSTRPVTTSHATGTAGASGPGTEATPTTAGASITILVVGDFGDGSESEYQVADVMETIAADESVAALVTTGDNFYTDDIEAAWTRPFGWVDDAGIPVYAAWGNHDVQSSTREGVVTSALDPPARWYSVPIGGANLIVLDANDPSDRSQLDWLEGALEDLGDGPALVSFHQPAFSCGTHGSTAAVQEYWVPLLRRGGVDLVLNGHDHNYQRFEAEGVTYVVSGGGGRDLYTVGDCPSGTPDPVAADDAQHHFLTLALSPDRIEGRVISDQATILDSFEMSIDPDR